MPWNERWPPSPRDPLDVVLLSELRAALLERDALVPALGVPPASARWDPLHGTPAGGDPPLRTLANYQDEIRRMLGLVWPLRWWDAGRETLYDLASLCQDAFGAGGWTWDLAAEAPGGGPAHLWSPAAAVVFAELYHAVNRLDRLRVLPQASATVRTDSVYRLTFGVSDWPTDRAATFALFDGADDGVSTGLGFDAGLGAEVFDDGFSQQWVVEARRFEMVFATAALAGAEIAAAWLDFNTEAPGGAADYADTFPAEVADTAGSPLATFDSDSYGSKHIAVPAGAVNPNGDTVLVVRSGRPEADDRPAWSPAGPNYTSTYREGLAVAGPVRLMVEVAFGYHD